MILSEKVLYVGESLLSMAPEDGRFRYVKAGLIVAACTKSAVHDPINFTIQHGEGKLITRLFDALILN